jgi:hypothetical protein
MAMLMAALRNSKISSVSKKKLWTAFEACSWADAIYQHRLRLTALDAKDRNDVVRITWDRGTTEWTLGLDD